MIILISFISLLFPAFVSAKVSKTKLWKRITEDTGEIQLICMVLALYSLMSMMTLLILSPLLKI